MIHQYTSDELSGDHWGVCHTSKGELLTQIASNGDQLRLSLDAFQAREFAGQLLVHAAACEGILLEGINNKIIRRIVCAANLVNNHIICGARHYDKIMQDQIDQVDEAFSAANVTQGFIDQDGVFLDRKEAYTVAKEAGQIIRRCGGDQGCLYSENLY